MKSFKSLNVIDERCYHTDPSEMDPSGRQGQLLWFHLEDLCNFMCFYENMVTQALSRESVR